MISYLPCGNISGNNRSAALNVPERDVLNELARCDREIAAYRAIIMTDERWLLAYADWQMERDMILDDLRGRSLMAGDKIDYKQDQGNDQTPGHRHEPTTDSIDLLS